MTQQTPEPGATTYGTDPLGPHPVRIDGLDLDPMTQQLLQMMATAGPPFEELPLEEGRAMLVQQSQLAGGEQPIGKVEDRTVPGAVGELGARLYIPTALLGPESPAGDPLVVFYHGGGFVYGDLESHEAVCRFLAEKAGVRVLAVDYRLAPEHPFPAAVEDAWAAFQWVADHAAEVGADPSRLAVAGDSAGGSLAASTALRAAVERVPLAFQLLIYPTTDVAETRSRTLFAEGFFLTRGFIDFVSRAFLGETDPHDRSVAVLHQKVPAGLAPAHVVTAGFDPLRDEGEAYAARLAEHAVDVTSRRYDGLIHGFANAVGFPGAPLAAMEEIADVLRSRLQAPGTPR